MQHADPHQGQRYASMPPQQPRQGTAPPQGYPQYSPHQETSGFHQYQEQSWQPHHSDEQPHRHQTSHPGYAHAHQVGYSHPGWGENPALRASSHQGAWEPAHPGGYGPPSSFRVAEYPQPPVHNYPSVQHPVHPYSVKDVAHYPNGFVQQSGSIAAPYPAGAGNGHPFIPSRTTAGYYHGNYPPQHLPNAVSSNTPVYNSHQLAHWTQLDTQAFANSQQSMSMYQPESSGLPFVAGGRIVQRAETLKIEELIGSATRDSFSVKTRQGVLQYKVSGSFTVNERKTMVDEQGKVILKIKEARMQAREKISIMNAMNEVIVIIRQSGMVQAGSKRANGYVGGHTQGKPIFTVTGNKDATVFRVTDKTGAELAVIDRKASSFKRKVTGQDSYETTVMPGVDQALMSMLTVACDEIWSD